MQCVSYFCVKPKSGEKEVSPKEFFGLWTSFCQEFKELWKREQKRISKERLVIIMLLSFVVVNHRVRRFRAFCLIVVAVAVVVVAAATAAVVHRVSRKPDTPHNSSKN